MTLLTEPLPCPDSPLRRLDPRWKLAGLLVLLAAVAFVATLPATLAALAFTLVLALVARLPLRWLAARAGALSLVLALFLLPLPLLLTGPGPVWSLGPLTVSAHGLATALVIAAKALALLLVALVMLSTSPLEDTLKAAHALHLPGLLVQLLALTYRYVFVLSHELARLRTALRVRGFRARPGLHTYRTAGHLAGALAVRGYERAERVGQAMRCRGFTGRFRSLHTFATRPRDVAAFLLLAAAACAGLAWDLCLR